MTNFPRLHSAGLRGARAVAKAQLTTVTEPTHTFYHQCYCERCRIAFNVPVTHKESDIPVKKRESVLEQVRQGTKLRWPYNPTEEEAAQIIASAVCPNDPHHKLKYVWAILAG